MAGTLRAAVVETDTEPPDMRIIGQPLTAGALGSSIGLFVAVGDFNGDGLRDVATNSRALRGTPGASIIFGREPSPATVDLQLTRPDVLLRESPPFRPEGSCFGAPPSPDTDDLFTNLAAGDVTGDGIDDLVIGGACWNVTDGFNGIVLVVSGRTTWPAEIGVDADTWSPAFTAPAVNGMLGASVAVADVDGNGTHDIVAGAWQAPSALTGARLAGRVYAVPGPIPDERFEIDSVASLIDGHELDAIGRVVTTGYLAPDVPHALVLGELLHGRYQDGRVLLLDGSALEPIAADDTTLAFVRQVKPTTIGERFGHAVGLGDVDCSGWGDLLVVSTETNRPDGRLMHCGRVDLFRDIAMPGGTSPPAPDLSVWGRVNWIGGSSASSRMIGTAALGDLNGDGFDDVIIGQAWSDGLLGDVYEQGDVTIIWNRPDLPQTLDLEDDTEWRLTLVGPRLGRGYGVTLTVADMDGNGRSDLLVGTATTRAVGDYHTWPDGGLDIFLRNLHVTSITPEAGPDQTVDIIAGATDCSTTVTLDARASIDRDGHAMRHRWYEGVTLLAEGEVVTVSLPAGDHCIRLLSTSDGGWAQDKLHVTVRDLAPPEIRSIAVDPAELWPPNHRMRPVHVIVDAWDACTPASELSVRLVSVTSNEPADERGDGRTDPDIGGWDVGNSDFDGELRAERSGRRGGREYTLTYEVRDASGNSAVGSTAVAVGHDRGSLRGSARSPRRR